MNNKPENPGAGYEKRDANIRGLVIFGIALFASLVVVLIVSAGLFRFFAVEQSLGPPASPFANVRALPSQPRLQANPRRDLQRWQEQERATLETYGWVDRSAGIVRIPIDQAMDLVIQRESQAVEKKTSKGSSK